MDTSWDLLKPLTIKEFARAFEMSIMKVRGYIDRGILKPFYLGKKPHLNRKLYLDLINEKMEEAEAGRKKNAQTYKRQRQGKPVFRSKHGTVLFQKVHYRGGGSVQVTQNENKIGRNKAHEPNSIGNEFISAERKEALH